MTRHPDGPYFKIPSREGWFVPVVTSNARWFWSREPYSIRIEAMRSTILLVCGILFVAAQPLKAQGVNDQTGPVPRYQTQQPLPSNTTPPTVNRQSNIFSPGAPTPRARRAYRIRRQ